MTREEDIEPQTLQMFSDIRESVETGDSKDILRQAVFSEEPPTEAQLKWLEDISDQYTRGKTIRVVSSCLHLFDKYK